MGGHSKPITPIEHVAKALHLTDVEGRRTALERFGFLMDCEQKLLAAAERAWPGLNPDAFTENAIGAFPMPLGLATNFVIDGRPRLVTMATEERSVVAAASYAAKLCLPEGFTTSAGQHARAECQITFTVKADEAGARAICTELGKALPPIEARLTEESRLRGRGRVWKKNMKLGPLDRDKRDKWFLTVELCGDPGDAMGAGMMTRLAERVAAELAPIVGRPRIAAVCSNDMMGWYADAKAVWTAESVGGGSVRDDIYDLFIWALNDQSRFITYRKGIMNGVMAVATATGQDTRAIEAGFWESPGSDFPSPIVRYAKLPNGNLEGHIQVHLPVGVVGGATGHPAAVACRRIMGIESASDLVRILAAVGLASNFAAQRALCCEGIAESVRRVSKKENSR